MGRRSRGTSKSLASPAGVRLRALLSLGMVIGLGSVGTFAAWSDEAKAEATFSAGTINLELRPEAVGVSALSSLSVSEMYPGSKKAALVEVANDGSLPFNYNITAGPRPGLGSGLLPALKVTLYRTDTSGNLGTDGKVCTGSLVAAGSTSFDSAKLFLVDRALVSKTTERLCVQVELPTTTGDEYQSLTGEAVFTFRATSQSA